ncbi:MAG TPA: UDP-N-acetylmuramoyl-tripeptide--D-alanyl-D-alanine ligase [Candidatus Eisenbergiella merdipullorum]|uniref:UDP-N-acetylmuramoyl-tripeptide--D-alanyl-D-alanine ligase n=1 Tax=Candidatus Eisenbergiella merdipullorum TaxID=2838553 RepID=A0A9D2I5P9_9FIRM|nr:UDP-N-acetylmuramoyl-tripeptide--D-alanyl-D-alanine ligase [Candidatus Eisenbergiella merdipullorum]
MKNMTLENLAWACVGKLVWDGPLPQEEAESVVIDSRKAQKGSVFIAVKGERVDGHRFIPDVFEKGALGVICEELSEKPAGPCILVKDSLKALRDIAAFYREQLPVKVVGITGSVGKTSTKEFIAAVLSQKYRVHKTQGNYNNEIGVPLTVLSMPEDAEAAVLEMGINHFGEMHRLSRIAQPDICVMTNIGQCHLEFLGSREGILKAKSEMFDYMKEDGCVILNGDDDMLSAITQVKGKKPLFYGIPTGPAADMDGGCGEDGEPGMHGRAPGSAGKYDVYAEKIRMKGLLGSEAVFVHDGEKFPVRIPLPGEHMVYNALAAAAVGFQLGLTEEEIAEGIASTQGVNGRSRIVQAGEWVLIDDCYNANPVSMEAAIDLLLQAKENGSDSRTVAVLGDMFELGEEEKKLHERVGRCCVEKGADCLICAGTLSHAMYEGALDAAKETGSRPSGGIHYFPDRQELLAGIPDLLMPGDTILVKASHGMGFEEVVKLLLTKQPQNQKR